MEVSAFNRLEQKIEELLSRLVDLKEENADLRRALAERDQRLQELEAERSQVRSRIEQLVQKIENYQPGEAAEPSPPGETEQGGAL